MASLFLTGDLNPMTTFEVTSPDTGFYALIEFAYDEGYGYQFIVSATGDRTLHSLYVPTYEEALNKAFHHVSELAEQGD